MKDEHLVSVIITTYKRSKFLCRAIESVVNQTYEKIEIIVVDDNGKENMQFREDTQNEIQLNFPSVNIKLLKNDTNKGACYSRNRGVENAEGNYLAFLDDDDVWHKEKIKKQVQLFDQLDENYGIVACYWNIIKNNKKEKIHKLSYKGNLSKILGMNHYAPTSMVLIKKYFFNEVGGFDIEYKCRQDIELYYRLASICKFDFVEEVLVDYYLHDSQISGNLPQKVEHIHMFFEKHKRTLSKFARGQLNEYLGDLHMALLNKKKGIKRYQLAIYFNPTRISQIIIKSTMGIFGYSRKNN